MILKINIDSVKCELMAVGPVEEMIAKLCIIMEEDEDIRFILSSAVDIFRDAQKQEAGGYYEGVNQN